MDNVYSLKMLAIAAGNSLNCQAGYFEHSDATVYSVGDPVNLKKYDFTKASDGKKCGLISNYVYGGECADNMASFTMDDGTVCQFQIEFNKAGDKISKITYIDPMASLPDWKKRYIDFINSSGTGYSTSFWREADIKVSYAEDEYNSRLVEARKNKSVIDIKENATVITENVVDAIIRY